MRIIPSKEFQRNFKQLYKKYRSLKNDYEDLKEELLSNPHAGVDLGNGLHKVRLAIASKGKGKSGGARIITYVVEEKDDDIIINLLTIYDKSEMDSVSESYINSLVENINNN